MIARLWFNLCDCMHSLDRQIEALLPVTIMRRCLRRLTLYFVTGAEKILD
jgi:hypothetical protein